MKLELPGTSFTAWVKVGDVEADIYAPEPGVPDKNGPVVKCWIESKAGKNFSLHWFDSERVHDSSGITYVDGVRIKSFRIKERARKGRRSRQVKKDKESYAHVSTIEVSPCERRELTFAEFQTTDDDSAPVFDTDPSKFGEIKIMIKYVETKEHSAPAETNTTNTDSQYHSHREKIIQQLGQNQKLHETSKKAGFHRFRLGKSIKRQVPIVEERKNCVTKKLGKSHYNLDPEILMAQGSMPRPSPPVEGTPNANPVHNVTPNTTANEGLSQDVEDDINVKLADLTKRQEEMLVEMAKLRDEAESLQNLKRKQTQIKSEPDLPDVKIKRERVMVPISKGEVIDLTELSD